MPGSVGDPSAITAPPVPPPPTAPAAAGATAVTSPAAPASQPRVDASMGMLMIGDSLGVGTDKPLKDLLAGKDVQVNAKGGRTLAQGMKEYDAVANKPKVVAMGLFTNNAPTQINELRDAIQKTIDDARARGGKVIWATIVRPDYSGKSYDEVNKLIRDMGAQNADVMRVVDWAAEVAAHPDWMSPDKIHANPTGYKERARLYVEAANS